MLHKFGEPIEILLVEDNPGDVRLIQEAFKENKILNNLEVVPDGVQAIKYLYKRDEFENVTTPDIIMLDLNLPKKNGFEVLEEIKIDGKLKRIPVIILTTSNSPEDINRAYDLHANCYITKSFNFEEIIDIISSIRNFWFSIVKLPQE